jgi:hypothetical protein
MNKSLLAVVLLVCACRTEIVPVVRTTEAPKTYARPEAGCDVRDFNGATDVPAGAKNLGWVQVKRAKTDEESYQRLRDKICKLGGDALSQLAWIRDPGEYEPNALKANAWVLP